MFWQTYTHAGSSWSDSHMAPFHHSNIQHAFINRRNESWVKWHKNSDWLIVFRLPFLFIAFDQSHLWPQRKEKKKSKLNFLGGFQIFSGFLKNFFVDFNAGKETTRYLKVCRCIVDRKELSKINLQSLQITEETLDFSLQNICEELFRYQ